MASASKSRSTRAARVAGPRKRVRRAPSWRRKFLAALAETSNVSHACAVAKITPSHVYATRQSDSGFAREWQTALCEGYDMLELELLRRLRSGDEDGDGPAKRKFDNATAFRLLSAHRESAARHRAVRDHDDAAAVRASIDAKVEEMRERVMSARKGADEPA
jgi:hypothetical protein